MRGRVARRFCSARANLSSLGGRPAGLPACYKPLESCAGPSQASPIASRKCGSPKVVCRALLAAGRDLEAQQATQSRLVMLDRADSFAGADAGASPAHAAPAGLVPRTPSLLTGLHLQTPTPLCRLKRTIKLKCTRAAKSLTASLSRLCACTAAHPRRRSQRRPTVGRQSCANYAEVYTTHARCELVEAALIDEHRSAPITARRSRPTPTS